MGFDLETVGVLTKRVEKYNLLEAAISVLAGTFFRKYSLGSDLGNMCWNMNMLLQVLVVNINFFLILILEALFLEHVLGTLNLCMFTYKCLQMLSIKLQLC